MLKLFHNEIMNVPIWMTRSKVLNNMSVWNSGHHQTQLMEVFTAATSLESNLVETIKLPFLKKIIYLLQLEANYSTIFCRVQYSQYCSTIFYNILPTYFPIPSLWVVPVHQFWVPCFMHRTWTVDLTLRLTQLEKEEMKNPRVSRRKEIIKIRAEINEKETGDYSKNQQN